MILTRRAQLNLLGILLATCFMALSYWQHLRAQEKAKLFATFEMRKKLNPLNNQSIIKKLDNIFYRAVLSGQFDHQHTILLDNRTYQGKIGYEIYTPFHLKNSRMAILVDRGFIPLTGRDRHNVPTLSKPNLEVISGLINSPPHYYAKGKMMTDTALYPLLRIQYIDISALSTLLGYPLVPFIVQLSPEDRAGYPQEWKSSIMPKEKHQAYALQWFALSLTLLVLLVALNMRKCR